MRYSPRPFFSMTVVQGYRTKLTRDKGASLEGFIEFSGHLDEALFRHLGSPLSLARCCSDLFLQPFGHD